MKYCDVNELIEWKQYFIDNIKPEYNFLLVAGSNFGFKHSTKTLLKLNSIKKTHEAIANIGLVCSAQQKRTKGHITIILNKETKSRIKYSSLVKQLKSWVLVIIL